MKIDQKASDTRENRSAFLNDDVYYNSRNSKSLTDMRATNGLPLLVIMICSSVYAARLAYSEKELFLDLSRKS